MGVREYNLPWFAIAKELIGTDEVPGVKSNPIIMNWAEKIGGFTEDNYTTDSIPWCGLFVAYCIKEADIDFKMENPLWARNWNTFGEKVDPCYGCIMVFVRDGGGHVGFYISEDNDTYHILGGNQSDTVNVTKISKDRLLGARWPTEYMHLKTQKEKIDTLGGKISRNEE